MYLHLNESFDTMLLYTMILHCIIRYG